MQTESVIFNIGAAVLPRLCRDWECWSWGWLKIWGFDFPEEFIFSLSSIINKSQTGKNTTEPHFPHWYFWYSVFKAKMIPLQKNVVVEIISVESN